MVMQDERWSGLLPASVSKAAWLEYVRGWEERIHAFLEFDPDRIRPRSNPQGPLSGCPVAVKDNIAVEGFRLTCGSKMLEELVSPYTATAVAKLQDAGAVVVGKTNLDEFGMGSSTDTSALAVTNNPWDPTRVAGGSSGGSAAAVAAGLVPFALGSDTGGSIRQPASFCGVFGLKPTYGSISRYGLVAYASSLEVIGIAARSVDMTRRVFEIVRGEDPYDQSSVEYAELPVPDRQLNVGVLPRPGGLHPDVERSYRTTVDRMRGLGFGITEIDLPMLEYVVPAYYTIATAEASANLSRFNGIRYGHRPEWSENPEALIRTSRDEGFGDEVKLRILLGTFVLRSGFQDQYYLRAQKIRTAIRSDFDRVFAGVDLLLMPTFPVPAFPHGEAGMDPFQQKLADRFTGAANLAGIPAFSFPATVENGLPIGMQLMAPAFGEELLFRAAGRYEAEHPAPVPPGYSESWRA